MLRGIFLALAACVALSACAEGTSVYHLRSMEEGASSITVDAKQRSAFVTVGTTTTTTTQNAQGGKSETVKVEDRQVKLCAEAAPDVFSALSGSGSLGVDIKSQSGNAGLAIAETAATIERTQTINMLREAMYRTCERYLSGAYQHPLTVIQAARDQQTMLRILAIEQLTRTVRPPATIISAAGTSASAANPAAVALATSLGKERSSAQTALSAAQTDYAKAQEAAKKAAVDCETVTKEPEEDDKKKLWTDCNTKKDERDLKQAALTEATSRFDNAVTALGTAGSTSGATAKTETKESQGGGGGSEGPGELALVSVAAAVREIATRPPINEVLMFCLSFLQSKGSDAGANVDLMTRQSCYKILDQREQEEIKLLQQDQLAVESYGPNISGRKLLSYLAAANLSKDESARRLTLLQNASANLKLSPVPIDMMDRIQRGDKTNDQLLEKAISMEQDQAGLSILKAN